MSGFIQDATKINTLAAEPPGAFDYLSHGLSKAAFLFLPRLSENSPVDALVDGMNISMRELTRESLVMVRRADDGAGGLWRALGFQIEAGAGLRAWLCLGLGCLIFWRRELAKVQV